ncbi:hypothetical protein [Methylophaga nitratireducenticrescens]|uniref:hypothetical protein n=1 Tax=Methylophaga nitratireducenticrescens TaxID=754476 RepID=UPI00059E2646|nr:hypothetical protein [Methylophaga nitratireducenticrescens]ASF49064.1 hypothetical protein Q7A_03240 [Methylophaga nitratireducenticrescens]AUZ83543.1 hypothetical protein CDW43_02705 [Methylophaga nitratireducenticrescens]
MSNDSEKKQHEVEVFREFVARSHYDIIADSIINGNHIMEEPDILCRTYNNEALAFELSGLTDENLMIVKKRWESKNAEYTRTSDPVYGIVSKKLTRVYAVSCPVHLLIYRNYLGTPDSMVVEQIKQTCKLIPHNFASIWYLGQEVHKIE